MVLLLQMNYLLLIRTLFPPPFFLCPTRRTWVRPIIMVYTLTFSPVLPDLSQKIVLVTGNKIYSVYPYHMKMSWLLLMWLFQLQAILSLHPSRSHFHNSLIKRGHNYHILIIAPPTLSSPSHIYLTVQRVHVWKNNKNGTFYRETRLQVFSFHWFV